MAGVPVRFRDVSFHSAAHEPVDEQRDAATVRGLCLHPTSCSSASGTVIVSRASSPAVRAAPGRAHAS
jgi:hypothetical protein